MNTTSMTVTRGRTLIAATVASVLLVACVSAPVAPQGAADVRARLTQLQSDPNLGSRAPLALKDAEVAVRTAEKPEADAALGSHRVYMADRKVEIARAQAETRLSEDQRAAITAERATARLDSRTREVDAARYDTAKAEDLNADLQREIDALKARPTDRGLVLTLGDVLFETGRADLKPGAATNLNQLVSFLAKYPTRTVAIEGHTDSVGSEDFNLGLSQRRAEAVRSHLVRQGVEAGRITTMGAGKGSPVASNETAAGRQQNRRVEVIISNPALASS
jgi:outer membrane protein OmpA-like peptidoglycan-associated protein